MQVAQQPTKVCRDHSGGSHMEASQVTELNANELHWLNTAGTQNENKPNTWDPWRPVWGLQGWFTVSPTRTWTSGVTGERWNAEVGSAISSGYKMAYGDHWCKDGQRISKILSKVDDTNAAFNVAEERRNQVTAHRPVRLIRTQLSIIMFYLSFKALIT